MPTWDEINAKKRLDEQRANLGIGGPMAQRATPDTPRQATSLSDHKPAQISPLTTTGDPVGHRPASEPVGHRPKKDTRVRPHLDIRLPNGSLDVERIVANWTAEKKAAPNVAAAIRLMDAILTGNTDYVRKNYPMLAEALGKPSRARATPPLKESYKERESKSEEKLPEVELLATALYEATGSDPHLNPAVHDLATQLHQANYTADDVRLWYQKCWPKDWRAKKGDWPALKDVRDLIGQVRSLPISSQDGSPADADNPYLQDEYFRRHTDEVFEPELKPEPVPEHHVPGWVQDRWLAAKGQLEVQLNRATFDTWLRHTQPVHFAGDRTAGTLYVSVPHRYAKEWIDKHLLTALNKLFDDLLNYDGQARKRISEQPSFDVKIIVEGDPVPGLNTKPD